MDFLKDFEKTVSKLDGVGGSSAPPRYWFSTGNYVLNKIISGSFFKGIPQGRITGLAGPSGAGKSFVLANVVKNAQSESAFSLVIDSENALDDGFMTAVGVDVDTAYVYKSVTTINQVSAIVSSFINGYKKEYGDDPKAPKVIIALDSLDMLLTETEQDQYQKGGMKGDQGQRNKQLKKLLRTFVQSIKGLNISMVVTSQVYKNQDVMNGEGVWIVSDAVKFSLSQIVLLTKLKLKDTGSRDVKGIRMKCEGYKTRFTKPYQTVTIEVPYESGMDPYSGLLEVAVEMGIVEKAGARYRLAGSDDSWYAKNIADIAETILVKAEANREKFLEVTDVIEEDDNQGETRAQTKGRRRTKISKENL